MSILLRTLLLATSLVAMSNPAAQADDSADTLKAMEAAGERVKASGDDFRAELKRIREERKLKEEQSQGAQRKGEEERTRQLPDAAEAAKEAAAREAAARETAAREAAARKEAARKEKERKELEAAAQEQARREAEEKMAQEQAERERLAALSAAERRMNEARAALLEEQRRLLKPRADAYCIDDPDPECGSATKNKTGTSAKPVQALQQASKPKRDASCLDNPDPECGSGIRINTGVRR